MKIIISKLFIVLCCILLLILAVLFLTSKTILLTEKEAVNNSEKKIRELQYFLSTAERMPLEKYRWLFNDLVAPPDNSLASLEETLRGEYAIYGMRDRSIVWELLKINRNKWFVPTGEYEILVVLPYRETPVNRATVKFCFLVSGMEHCNPNDNWNFIGFQPSGKIDLFFSVPGMQSVATKIGLNQNGTFILPNAEYEFLQHILSLDPAQKENRIIAKRIDELKAKINADGNISNIQGQ